MNDSLLKAIMWTSIKLCIILRSYREILGSFKKKVEGRVAFPRFTDEIGIYQKLSLRAAAI